MTAPKKDFTPVNFYPPGTTADAIHQNTNAEMVATNEAEFQHLTARGWLPSDEIMRPLRQREAAERLAADKAEKEAARLAAEDAERTRKEAKANAVREKALQAQREAEERKQKETEARVNFIIQASNARARVLEDRNMKINELLVYLPNKISAASGDEQAGLARQLVECHEERRRIAARLAEMGEQARKDIEEAYRA